MKKPLNDTLSSKSLGEKLAQMRYKQGRTIVGASRALSIKKEQIKKLEELDEKTIQSDIYVRGYLGQYAEYLGYPVEEALKEYDELTKDSEKEKKEKNQSFLRNFKIKQSIVSSRLFMAGVVTLLLISVSGYVFWQVRALASPPSLKISSPEQEQVIFGSEIEVSGQAEKGSEVFVNNQAVLTDDSGNFSTIVPLSEGVNEVTIHAINKLGKEISITRTVLLKLPQEAVFPDEKPEFPVLEISTKEEERLLIRADGAVIYEGLIFPGESKVFKAENQLELETLNPELFRIKYANPNVIEKEFMPLKALEERDGVFLLSIKTPTVDETGE